MLHEKGLLWQGISYLENLEEKNTLIHFMRRILVDKGILFRERFPKNYQKETHMIFLDVVFHYQKDDKMVLPC